MQLKSATNQEAKIMKVIVLNDAYFPLQKLQIRFSGMILQHMEMDESIPLPTIGMQFGIVQKLERSFRSNTKYGVICEVLEFEYESTTANMDLNPSQPTSQPKGFVLVKAIGRQRFQINRILHRALEGLIMTCECVVFNEVNSDVDKQLQKSEKFQTLKNAILEFCKAQQTATSPQKQVLFQQKAEQVKTIESAIDLTYFVCQMLQTPTKQDLQSLLENNDAEMRMTTVTAMLLKELGNLQDQREKRDRLSKSLKDRVMGMAPNQSQENSDEIKELESKLDSLDLPEEAKRIYKQEIKKLKQIGPRNQEYHVSMNYLQTMADLPWGVYDIENVDPDGAMVVLDKDHFGLEAVKTRIVQFLAVRKLTKNSKGTIMCFHGPPGVGKTSLGRSIAEALGRKFYRISLGGVRDEAEIRGHRRTYVGSMPGVIISSLKKIKSSNPVMLLDEIDKMGKDARGDPSAAFLEVLDPAQNDKFTDHFLGTPFDLSKVMFIATANSLDTIHPALLDRMEIIDINGYSLMEKIQIAQKYLIPRQIRDNGITDQLISFKEKEVKYLISSYTMESGVRNLERAIGSVCRIVAYRYAVDKEPQAFKTITVDNEIIREALGNQKIDTILHESITRPGVAIGLAWSQTGGQALLIETTKFAGSGQFTLTGQLGDVMKESIVTGLSWIRANMWQLGLVKQAEVKVLRQGDKDLDDSADQLLKKFDLHVHFPAASVPKDGPSAGVTITVALVSLFTGRRVKSDFAMTGELSLQGLVLPVGGIKEKCMAAHRNKIRNVILPVKNREDTKQIPEDVKKELFIHFVERIEDALTLALEDYKDPTIQKQEILPFFREKL